MKLAWTLVIAALAAAILFLVLSSGLRADEFRRDANGRLCSYMGNVPFCAHELPYSDVGIASIYHYSSKKTASGDIFDPTALTAAHKSLPFGTRVKVTNKKNGLSVIVTINDRGPFVRGRIIDLTPAAAKAIKFSGLARVEIRLAK